MYRDRKRCFPGHRAYWGAALCCIALIAGIAAPGHASSGNHRHQPQRQRGRLLRQAIVDSPDWGFVYFDESLDGTLTLTSRPLPRTPILGPRRLARERKANFNLGQGCAARRACPRTATTRCSRMLSVDGRVKRCRLIVKREREVLAPSVDVDLTFCRRYRISKWVLCDLYGLSKDLRLQKTTRTLPDAQRRDFLASAALVASAGLAAPRTQGYSDPPNQPSALRAHRPRRRALLATGMNLSHWLWLPKSKTPTTAGSSSAAKSSTHFAVGLSHVRLPIDPASLWDRDAMTIRPGTCGDGSTPSTCV